VLGGGGIAVQDTTVLGGGGIAVPVSFVRGAVGMAEQDSAVLGAVGMADPDSAVLGGGGIAVQVSFVRGDVGMAEHDTEVLGGGGIAEHSRSVLGGDGITEPGRVAFISPMVRLPAGSVTAAAEEFPAEALIGPAEPLRTLLPHRAPLPQMSPASSDVQTTTRVRSPRNRSRANSSGSPDRA